MATGAHKPLIFISYSKFDDAAKTFVARQLGVLRHIGDVDIWDDSAIGVGDDWFDIIDTNLKRCSVAVLLISADFLGSEFCMRKEVPALLERRQREGMMIAPVLLRPCAWEIVPWLAAIQMQPRRDVPLLTLDEFKQADQLKQLVLVVHEHLTKRKALVEQAIEEARSEGMKVAVSGDGNNVVPAGGGDVVIPEGPAKAKADGAHPPLPESAVDLSRLPTSGYDVVGREAELRFLNDALDGDELNVVSLRAWGGVGKSTLLNKWCAYLAADSFRGARRVFAWSFHSQGSGRDGAERTTAADLFIDEAMRFFAADRPVSDSPWLQGERLAEVIGREKALLILDGMEPLQDAHQGIQDPALARLVECLAEENAGLCVITTRMPVKELSDFAETTKEINLEQLSKEAGRALLRIKGLRAGDDLLEQASESFGNHALALDLLASYLKRFADGDVGRAQSIPDLPEIPEDAGRHPRRLMSAFVRQFGDGPERDLLHLLGLFDRPADGACIKALLNQPAIAGLTEKLSALDQAAWRDLLHKLRGYGLLAGADHQAPDDLDAHPLVREHFAERLRAERPDAWREGHHRLYEHLQAVPKKHRPETLAEMTPLFQAVHHACRIGRWQDALRDVYKPRILRDGDFYLTKKLGAFGADLGLLACFFDPPFAQPAKDLDDRDRAWLLNQAAFSLRALGRLDEAVAPARASLKADVRRRSWKGAAVSATILSELKLALGDIAAAVAAGEAALTYADISGDDFFRMVARTALANGRTHADKLEAAKALFEEAEAMQSEQRPSLPKLYSIYGFRYCDLLLALGQVTAAHERAIYSLELSKNQGSLLSIALDHLTLARAAHAAGRMDDASSRFQQALGDLRNSGAIDLLTRGLLERAAFLRDREDFDRSRRDLAEAMRIATRCGMRLYRSDAELESARLALAEGRRDDALAHYRSAAALVTECGYHRRDGEVSKLEEELAP